MPRNMPGTGYGWNMPSRQILQEGANLKTEAIISFASSLYDQLQATCL